jgi:hypothetical protein
MPRIVQRVRRTNNDPQRLFQKNEDEIDDGTFN